MREISLECNSIISFVTKFLWSNFFSALYFSNLDLDFVLVESLLHNYQIDISAIVNNGWCVIRCTNFGRSYSLYLAFPGHFEDIFEILRVSAICRPQKIGNWLESDQATGQNVKVYQNLVRQKWWFSKTWKKLNTCIK